jgi:predicted outer membrane repeat protein
MHLLFTLFSALLTVLLCTSVNAAVINIPDDFEIIQEAIDESENGDTVLVQPGVYYENLVINDRTITIGSLFITTEDTSYIDSTVIDGSQVGNTLSIAECDQDPVQLIGLTISNRIEDNRIKGGLGILCQSSNMIIERCHITLNAHGMVNSGESEVVINNCLFRYNGDRSEHSSPGGAIRLHNSSLLNINHCSFINNFGSGGGGIYCTDNSRLVTEDSYFLENSAYAYGGPGAAICSIDSSEVSVNNCIINNSTTEMFGGAIFHGSNRLMRIRNCEMAGNSFLDIENLGEIEVSDCHLSTGIKLRGTASLQNGTFDAQSRIETLEPVIFNECDFNGRYVSVYEGNPIITNSRFINTGIACNEYSSLTLSGISMTGSPWIRCEQGSTLSLKNCTISGSEHDEQGLIECYNNSTINIINSILWNNGNPQIRSYRAQFDEGDSITITIAYSDLQGGNDAFEIPDNAHNIINWLEGNIDEDPQFVNPEESDFSLTEDSPCVDTGTAFLVIDGDTLVNLSDDRYSGDAPDMGAFEYGFSIVDLESNNFPTAFNLLQAYPNPFNSSTRLEYEIPQAGQIAMSVYDLTGREIVKLADGWREVGKYNIVLEGGNLTSGVYLISLDAGGRRVAKQVQLLK